MVIPMHFISSIPSVEGIGPAPTPSALLPVGVGWSQAPVKGYSLTGQHIDLHFGCSPSKVQREEA